jgi:hypothetical protein
LLFLDCCPVDLVDVGPDEEVISPELPHFEVLSVFLRPNFGEKNSNFIW